MFSKKIFKDMTGNPSKMEVSSEQLIMVHPWLNFTGGKPLQNKKYPSSIKNPFEMNTVKSLIQTAVSIDYFQFQDTQHASI